MESFDRRLFEMGRWVKARRGAAYGWFMAFVRAQMMMMMMMGVGVFDDVAALTDWGVILCRGLIA